MDQSIKPATNLHGKIAVPGDKSISHRALLLGAIAQGTSHIHNLSPGKDVMSTRGCLAQLGISIEDEASETIVKGGGLYGLRKPVQILDAGNSGTTVRLLSGILAAQPFASVIDGDASLQRRPMARIIAPLREMGAHIEAEEGGTLPLHIHGGRLNPIDYFSPVASAQVKSCLLLAALYADGETQIDEPGLSRNHTEIMLPIFGVDVKKRGRRVGISGQAAPHAADVDVPGDLSSAAFFIVAALLVSGSHLMLKDIGINPTRIGLLRVLESMGARGSFENQRTICGEPRADIYVRSSDLQGASIGGDIIPEIIDELPILAIAATQAYGETVVRHAKELRVKESDRIEAVAMNLRAMGAPVKAFEDGFVIRGPQRLRGATIDSYHDHRIAMAFAIAGLLADGETVIKSAECAEISYPGFFNTLHEMALQ